MPEPQIQNPLGAYTVGAQWGNAYATVTQDVMELKNNSAAARTVGDVVVIDVTGDLANTTTTANDTAVVGVVGPTGQANNQTDATTYAVGVIMPVVVSGPARINIASNTVAAKDVLTTTTAAGVAGTNAGDPVANAVIGSLIGVALEANSAKDANNTIRAYIHKF